MNMEHFEIYSEKNQIRGRKYFANPEKKKEKTILMCHGFAGIQDLFFPQYAAKFSEEGFDVVTFDYNGFGESEGTSEIVPNRSEEHTSELQSRQYLVCRLLLEKKK